MEDIKSRIKCLTGERKKRLVFAVSGLWALAGFACAFARLGSTALPFASALTAVLPFPYCLGSFAGAAAAGLVMLPETAGVSALLAAGLALSIRLFFRGRDNVSPLLGAAAALIASLAAHFIPNPGAVEFIGCLFDGFATLGAILLIRPLANGVSLSEKSSRRAVLVLIFAAGGASTLLGSDGTGGLNFVRIAVVTVFMLFCLDSEPLFCCGLGAIGGFFLASNDRSLLILCPALALGALAMCSVKKGHYKKPLAFCGASLLVLITGSAGYSGLFCAYELAICTAICVTVPLKAVSAIRSLTSAKGTPVTLLSDNGEYMYRLSKAFSDVGKDFEKAEGMLASRRKRKLDANVLAEAVCRRCNRKNRCWNANYSIVSDSLNRLTSDAAAGIAPPELPPFQCIRYSDIKRVIQAGGIPADPALSIPGKTVCEQFSVISDLLVATAERCSAEYDDEYTRLQITALCEKKGISPLSIRALTTPDGRISILLVTEVPPDGELKEHIAQSVLQATKTVLGNFKTKKAPGGFITLAASRPQLEITYFCAQRAAGDAQSCGDVFAVEDSGTTQSLFIISDGMGTGGSAEMDGAMTAGIFSRLFSAGCTPSLALRCANTALMARCDNETTATFDGLIIDRYTSQARLIKAGAFVTYLLRNGAVRRFEGGSLPIGIIGGPEFFTRETKLLPNDIIVMASDGVGDEDLLEKELLLYKKESLRTFCETAAEKAAAAQGGRDDVTVMAIKVS